MESLPAIVITPDGAISRAAVPPRLAMIIIVTQLSTNPDAAFVQLGSFLFIPYQDISNLIELMNIEISDATEVLAELADDDTEMREIIEFLLSKFKDIRAACDDSSKFEELPEMDVEDFESDKGGQDSTSHTLH